MPSIQHKLNLNDKLAFCQLLKCSLQRKTSTLTELIQNRLLDNIIAIEQNINKLLISLEEPGCHLSLEELAEPRYGFSLLSNGDLYSILFNDYPPSTLALDEWLVLANNDLVKHNGDPLHDCACLPQAIHFAHYFLRDRLVEYVNSERDVLAPFSLSDMDSYLSRTYNWISISEIMNRAQRNVSPVAISDSSFFIPIGTFTSSSDDVCNKSFNGVLSEQFLASSKGPLFSPRPLLQSQSRREPLQPPPVLPLMDEHDFNNSCNSML